MKQIELTISKNELKKFKKGVDLFGLNVAKRTKIALLAAGLEGESVARAKSPVGTPESTGIRGYAGGNLKASNGWRSILNGFGVEIFNNAEYAQYVNDGTSRMKARPFFQKGFNAAVGKFKRLMRS